MPKRKREVGDAATKAPNAKVARSVLSTGGFTSIQIITGSYNRVLHGVVAQIPLASQIEDETPTDGDSETTKVFFSDSFLFHAHSSALRCLALSPAPPPSENQTQKRLLATGSTDERINIYQLSNAPPSTLKPQLPSINGATLSENPKNREVGSLLHHASSITALHFPTRSKLLSAGEDSTVAVTRTRDWTVLSTIKVPVPKIVGRPSGDTAGPGEVPAGVNDFAVHPSNKLMLTVSKGEKSMRLWNLVTGKKAGVLTFDRAVLQQAGEGKHGRGECRRLVWDEEGEEFAVCFERGVVTFGMDCKPKARILPTPITKIHQIQYLPESFGKVLAVSTEDGRVILYSTASPDEPTDSASNGEAKSVPEEHVAEKKTSSSDLPSCDLIGVVGGDSMAISGRIKDFQILEVPGQGKPSEDLILVTGSSDGTIRVCLISKTDLSEPSESPGTSGSEDASQPEREIGTFLESYETNHRITCLKAFVMTGKPDEEVEDKEEWGGIEEDDTQSSEESE
ncbi:WD40 repeat-like protein [Eremomyces bilateralis CBS 781.70]|uniref:WD40 repeat-like protein n=1 Tax=Eremomyces bilateralis CBS 781.70 TaxID=1392243 RepID=A0A6G1GB60_9PEZI|nr:WD40 repeat-like protein [Eremomyces bilateralis CBS 781.70]KAF1815337.1 WD40 repeat-like protein [Eremomyces bilateralis CBS 781.70]